MMGQLVGKNFLTVAKGADQLMDLGNDVLWKGGTSLALSRP
jgi:hypothetical protein